jgi:hypothetical protein
MAAQDQIYLTINQRKPWGLPEHECIYWVWSLRFQNYTHWFVWQDKFSGLLELRTNPSICQSTHYIWRLSKKEQSRSVYTGLYATGIGYIKIGGTLLFQAMHVILKTLRRVIILSGWHRITTISRLTKRIPLHKRHDDVATEKWR